MSTPTNLSEQILALPNGAGSMQPAGQTFEVSPYTGTGSYTVPIETPVGHAGLSQKLSLNYSTHAGNGIAGQGWSLSLASIERRVDKGIPSYDNSEDLFALQGDELLPVGGSSYRPRIERRFSRMRHVVAAGRDFWAVTERNGSRVLYGLEPDHRLHDDAGRIAAWYVSKAQDANGNEVLFSYSRSADTKDARLASIEWAGCYRVSFGYERRPDPIVTFRPGFQHRQEHRLSTIDLQVRSAAAGDYSTYRTYALLYRTSSFTGRSLLASISITGVNPDGAVHEMPPVTITYTEPDLARKQWYPLSGGLPGGSLKDRNLTLVRQSGSGLPDLLETTETGHWLRTNLGSATFSTPRRVTSPAQVLLEQPGTFISDMSGHGFGDLVVDGGSKVYKAAAGGGWGGPYISSRVPSVDLEAEDVRVADLNGDGIPDALRAGVGSWVFFENLGDGDWAPGRPVVNPPPVRLDDPRVHLADINGDGIPDLVYVDRHRVRVWPGQGSGRFGSPFDLAHPPDFGAAFDPRAVRWADMTGSGEADLLYVQNGNVSICFNHSGTSLSDPVAVAGVAQSSQGHVEPVDLLGSGAQGLLFTDYQQRAGTWRYLDVFAGNRPDLLNTVDSGFGAVSTIEYTSSARDWIADKRAGRPWRTSLPSPQVVVASIDTVDTVTGSRLGVTYRYHNGVYDGTEREFRGFAMVEQIEREAPAGDAQPLAPVLVKRWYHTGEDIDLRHEYTALPGGAVVDDVPSLPWAQRSLRGLLQREETFAVDGNPLPYLVAETAYCVFSVQRQPGTARYSFAPLPITSRSTYLERSDERRISETTTIYDLDSGQGYGLPAEIREKAFGRTGADIDPGQGTDIERYTVTRYVSRDEPDADYFGEYTPAYLAGFPVLTERYGVTQAGDVLLNRERTFYDGEEFKGLGSPGSATQPGVTRGRLSCKLVLAFSDAALAGTFPSDSGARTHFDERGHYLDDGGDYYIHSERYRYDSRGMRIASRDPNGNESSFTYDSTFGLFSVLSIDPAGHPTRIVRGGWPFQVANVLDANGNTTSYTYDPSGLVLSRCVQGKYDGNDWLGDPPSHPTETYEYDFAATPVRVVVRTRQVRLGATLDTYRYVDGFGRTVQELRTAEPDSTTGAARYRVSGWKTYNHKGLVVRLYQPAFADSSDYREGVTSTSFVETCYDPLGRVVRLNHPDGTFETTTYHPWVRTFADRNDNSAHITAADPRYGRFIRDLMRHAGTPARTYVDALGRDIAVAEDNGGEIQTVRKVLDLNDRVIELHDGRGLADATSSFAFDHLGRPVYGNHRAATGERYTLSDAAGNPIWARDARGTEVIRTFDALNRPLDTWSDDGSGFKLRRRSTYATYDELAPEFLGYQARNLFGPVEEERDADGLRFFDYDWRGLVTKTTYRFWPQSWDDSNAPLWTQGAAFDPPIPVEDREVLPSMELPSLSNTTEIQISSVYDAAGRVIESVYPEGMRTVNSYNTAGLLAGVSVNRGAGDGLQIVTEGFEYNARGQDTFYSHGNGVVTSREYDEELERITRIFTRLEGASPVYFQDLAYAHDPVGNLVEIADNLTGSAFSHNRIIPNTRTFGYDPRHRLIRATGKKHRGVRRGEDGLIVTSPDPNDYEPYTFRYSYDAAGNFERNPEYASGTLHYKTDRLDQFDGDDSEQGNFEYDANGNTTHTPRHQELAYTHDNQARYVNLNGGGQVRYFRHGDQRVVRLVKKNGVTALSIYLGPFEYQLRKAARPYTKLVLHIYGHGRHAQAERVLSGSDRNSLPLFFHHADHLGSGHVLTRDDGDLLNQEENFPYGGISDRRDARNRYRFIGVERDEDTHLCMTGPRTYDPAIGRFLQSDPIAETRPEVSPYVYSSASPLVVLDPGGYSGKDSEDDFLKEFGELDDSPLPGGAPRPQRPVVDFGNFSMTNGEREMYLEWVNDRIPMSAAAQADVKGLWTNGDPLDWARVNGMDTGLRYGEAQTVYSYGVHVGDNELINAADEVMRDSERAIDIYSDAAKAGNAAAEVGLRSAAEAGLDVAKRHALAGIPLIGLFFSAMTVKDMKEAYDKGDYGMAVVQAGSLVFDPADWALAVDGAKTFVVESYKEYRAEQTSMSIMNEIRKIEAQKAGEPWPPVQVSKDPCPSCHW